MVRVLVATQRQILGAKVGGGVMKPCGDLGSQLPTCLAADPRLAARAWCGTSRGVVRSDDGGMSWQAAGLEDQRITAIAVSTVENVIWAGTEPSGMWRSEDDGKRWERSAAFERLPSSSEWSFPPKPDTHHVRWISCDPVHPGRLWVAVEAGALVFSADGGQSWRDRVPRGPFDTHELAIHAQAPATLRVSAGDGYFESPDGGVTWETPRAGLEVSYLRSVAIDPANPDVVLVSASSAPRRAYVAGVSDGRLYRRVERGRWERILDGWPNPPATIAPLLLAGGMGLCAADERGVHWSDDGGSSWRQVNPFVTPPQHLRGIALIHEG